MSGSKRKTPNISDLNKQHHQKQLSLNVGPTTSPISTVTTTSSPPKTSITNNNNNIATHLVPQPGARMNTTRKIHYAFTILYAVAAFTIVASSIIWINFWTTFQSGALALNVGIAFALFGTTIVGKLDRKTIIGEFIVYRKCAVIIGITAIIALIFALFPLFNIVNILTKCPAYAAVNIDTNSNTKSSIKTIVGNDTPLSPQSLTIGKFVDLTGNYEFIREGKKIQNRFYLTYDITHQTLTQKQKIGVNRWIQIDSSNIEVKTLSSLLEELNELPLTTKNNMSKYYFLEQEVKRLIGESNYNMINIHEEIEGVVVGSEMDRTGVVDEHEFKTSESAYAKPNTVKASTNPLYLELMAQEICHYEYAFAILWSIFIILLILLNIATVPAYAWIKSATT